MKFFYALLLLISTYVNAFTFEEDSTCTYPFRLVSGTSNPDLSQRVSDILGIPLSKTKIDRFNDGEVDIQIQENIRGCDVYVIQSTCPCDDSTVNDNVIELYLLIRALKRASAHTVTAVMPYFGYARQDRKIMNRVSISASDMAMLFESAGADHVMAVDLHCEQIQGFFHEAPVDNLFASRIFIPYIAKLNLQNLMIVSPDAGGVERAKNFMSGLKAQGLNSHLAIIVKERIKAGEVSGMSLVGNVEGSDVVIVDDICDTAGTLCKAAKELKEKGAKKVIACITHPVFSSPALERIGASEIDELVVTDTVAFREKVPDNITLLSIAPLLAEAISRTHEGKSLSCLFRYGSSF